MYANTMPHHIQHWQHKHKLTYGHFMGVFKTKWMQEISNKSKKVQRIHPLEPLIP